MRTQIQNAINQKWVLPLRPRIPGSPEGRALLLVPSIHEELNNFEDLRWVSVRTDLERFIGGGQVSVSSHPRKTKHADIAQMDRADEEIWEIRHCVPLPHIRIYGRFAYQNYFIGLDYEVKGLGWSDRDAKNAKKTVRCKWDQFFFPYPPLIGKRSRTNGEMYDDYLTNYVLV